MTRLSTSNLERVKGLIQSERLPDNFARTVAEVYAPIVEALGNRFESSSDKPAALVGINGCPGSGKSTLARFVPELLGSHRIAILSLDDFYLKRTDRVSLSTDIHPLLRNRGMPGTHDVELLAETIKALRYAGDYTETRIPVFDKSKDDRLDRSEWKSHKGKPDIVLLEGWCVGIHAEAEGALGRPDSRWESTNDPDGRWRRYVNQQLQSRYTPLFSSLDMLILLKAPTVETIFKWRRQQEDKLREVGDAMNNMELSDFMMQFVRLTRHMYATLPQLADVLVEFEEDRTLRRLRCR